MDTQFAKIVTTPRGDAILIDGTVIEICAPMGRNDEFVDTIVRGLRTGRALSAVSNGASVAGGKIGG